MGEAKTVPSGSRRRAAAARACAGILEASLFRALCEPGRIEIVRLLLARGRSDLGSLAAELPQDISVVSRHLAVLHEAGIVLRQREGRHVHFEIDGPTLIRRFEEILERLRGTVPLCCPGTRRDA